MNINSSINLPDTDKINSPDLSLKQSVLLNLLENNLHLPRYQLTDSEKQWIQVFIKIPCSNFDEIDEFLIPILSSGQINVHVVPKLIKLLADNYYKISHEKNIFNYHNIIMLITYTIDVILDLISLTPFETIIIKSFVDYSLILLNTNINEKPKKENLFPPLIQDVSNNNILDGSIPPDSVPAEASLPLDNLINSNKICCWNLNFFNFFK